MRGGAQTGATIDGRSEVVAVAPFGLAGAERHADLERRGGWPGQTLERGLERDRSGERRAGSVEEGEDAVALTATHHHAAASLFHPFLDQRVVEAERLAHRDRALFP